MFHDAPSPAPQGTAPQAWCILHTALGQGAHFLHTWQAWRANPQRPALLHYVALAEHLPALATLPPELQAAAQGLGPGQHRLCFDEGRVLLTLCIGPRLAMLRQQQFEADVLVLDTTTTPPDAWDDWAVKALVRCCKRGTRLELQSTDEALQQRLRQCGFDAQDTFNPPWQIKTTRETWRSAQAAAGTCAVIGAGIAGASVAASLARRGWQVQVQDQGATPATGASGLPVGLAVPHVSVDDCVQSRLSRSGVRLSLQQASLLLAQGQDWAPSGVQEYLLDDNTAQAIVPPSRWHGEAGWIKPAALARAWLAQPGIVFTPGVAVQRLQRSAAGWTLLDAAGHAITTVARVVLANATGALPLLQQMQVEQPALGLAVQQLPAVYGVRGLVSWAAHVMPETRPFPLGPVNGSGSLIPFVPVDGELRWFVGASYQPVGQPEWPDDKNHGANVLRLDKLEPLLSQALTPELEAGALQAWKGTRCVTADRLPLVGSLLDDDPTLWLCAGMGSRGLTYAALCAELLAAQWAGEPLPVELSLVQSLVARRKQLRS